MKKFLNKGWDLYSCGGDLILICTSSLMKKQFIERFHAQPGQGEDYCNPLRINASEGQIMNTQQYLISINKFLKFYKKREDFYFNLLLKEGKISEDEFNEFKNNFKDNFKDDAEIQYDKIPKIGDLLRKSRYYLTNVHPIGQYYFSKMSKRIVNIGGVEGEMEDYIKNKKIPKTKQDVPESSNRQLLGDFPRNKEEETWIYKVSINFNLKFLF